MAEVTWKPDCPVCGRTRTCIVQKFGRDRMTVSCVGFGNQVHFTFDDAKFVNGGTL